MGGKVSAPDFVVVIEPMETTLPVADLIEIWALSRLGSEVSSIFTGTDWIT